MTHTPGPWRYSARNIYSKELNTVIAQCWDEMIFTTEPLPVEANGRLIAAAPDLLEACEGLVNYRDSAGPINFQLEKADDFIRLMRLAIAKTRGEE